MKLHYLQTFKNDDILLDQTKIPKEEGFLVGELQDYFPEEINHF